MSAAGVIWRFSRPHTIVGTVVSIIALYVIICHRELDSRPLLLLSALAIGICCNIFIVGINQLADVAIDEVNKPYLPLPAGELSTGHAWWTVITSLVIALGLAAIVSPWLFIIVAFAAFLGWAYSMPPLHLKRHHLFAAVAITTVRGVVVNLGGFVVYDHVVHGKVQVPTEVWMLTGFIVAFSTAIAWFKDLPDVKGDARYGIRTLALAYSPRTALIAGHVLVGIAYVATIGLLLFRWVHGVEGPRTLCLLLGHLALFSLFVANAAALRMDDPHSVRAFYVRFWWFFFAEYLLYLVAYLCMG